MATRSVGNYALRQLTAEDTVQVKILCSDCFPIEYTDRWFSYITSNKVYSLGCFRERIEGAISEQQLIAMVVAEEQPLQQIESEIGPILRSADSFTTTMYIISLGVLSQYRKQGLGSLLINSLFSHISTLPSCKALYLHVQASNTAAQTFYNQLGFREVVAVPNYYFIQKQHEDAYIYCCYTNGGIAFPYTIRSYLLRYYEGAAQCLAETYAAITTSLKRLFPVDGNIVNYS